MLQGEKCYEEKQQRKRKWEAWAGDSEGVGCEGSWESKPFSRGNVQKAKVLKVGVFLRAEGQESMIRQESPRRGAV